MRNIKENSIGISKFSKENMNQKAQKRYHLILLIEQPYSNNFYTKNLLVMSMKPISLKSALKGR